MEEETIREEEILNLFGEKNPTLVSARFFSFMENIEKRRIGLTQRLQDLHPSIVLPSFSPRALLLLVDSFWSTENDNMFVVFSGAFPRLHIHISNVSTASSQDRATFLFSQNPQTQQSNVEVLRQMLGKVCLKENSNVKHSTFIPSKSSDTSQSSLNSAAGLFFSKYAN